MNTSYTNNTHNNITRDAVEVRHLFTTGEELLDAAVKLIDSDSIRHWAGTEHNRPILIKIAQGVLDKNNNAYSELRFATWLICESMGF